MATSSESLRCARNASEKDIFNGYKLLDEYMIFNQSKFEAEIFLPTIDNIVFSKSIDDLARENAFKKCNIITGFNSDEASLFTLSTYGIIGYDDSKYLDEAKSFNFTKFMTYLNLLYKYFPYYPELSNTAITNSIINQYFKADELNNSGSLSAKELINRLNRIFSDNQYVCNAYDIANVYSKSGQNAYVYKFQYRTPTSQIPSDLVDYFGTATHADELFVTFGYLLTASEKVATGEDKKFTQDILAYWSNFVKFDDPNGIGFSSLTKWQPFLANKSDKDETGRTIVFKNSGNSLQTGFSENKCNFWNSNIRAATTSKRRILS